MEKRIHSSTENHNNNKAFSFSEIRMDPLTFSGHITGLLLEPVVVLHHRRHHSVRALHIEGDLVGRLVLKSQLSYTGLLCQVLQRFVHLPYLDNDAHPLGLRGERENVEDVKGAGSSVGQLQSHRVQIARVQTHTHRLRPLHERHLKRETIK